MRDYKKTVSDLRNFNANYESNKLTNDAADAIEELLAESADLVEQVKCSQEEIRKLDKELATIRNQPPKEVE